MPQIGGHPSKILASLALSVTKRNLNLYSSFSTHGIPVLLRPWSSAKAADRSKAATVVLWKWLVLICYSWDLCRVSYICVWYFGKSEWDRIIIIIIIPQMNPLSVTSFFAALPSKKGLLHSESRPYVQWQGGEGKLSAEISLRAGPASSLCSPHWKKVLHKWMLPSKGKSLPWRLSGNPAKQGTTKETLIWVPHIGLLLFSFDFFF